MQNRVARTGFGVFGVLLMVFGAWMVAVAATELITGVSKSSQSTLIGLMVLFSGATFWGFWIARSNFEWRLPGFPVRIKRRRDQEQAVIAYAASAGGRVTIVEIAGRCDLTVEESKEILDHFAAQRVAELLVTEDGTLVYDFDVLSAKEKASAKDVL